MQLFISCYARFEMTAISKSIFGLFERLKRLCGLSQPQLAEIPAPSEGFHLCVVESGKRWYPYSVEFETPEGLFRIVMYAISDYHAAILIDD